MKMIRIGNIYLFHFVIGLQGRVHCSDRTVCLVAECSQYLMFQIFWADRMRIKIIFLETLKDVNA